MLRMENYTAFIQAILLGFVRGFPGLLIVCTLLLGLGMGRYKYGTWFLEKRFRRTPDIEESSIRLRGLLMERLSPLGVAIPNVRCTSGMRLLDTNSSCIVVIHTNTVRWREKGIRSFGKEERVVCIV